MPKSKKLHGYSSRHLRRLRSQKTKDDLQKICSFKTSQHENCTSEQFQSSQSHPNRRGAAPPMMINAVLKVKECDELDEKERTYRNRN